MKIGVYLRTISYVLAIIIVCAVCVIPACIVALLPEKIRFKCKPFYWLVYGAYCLLVRSLWVPVTYAGVENIPKQPCIFAANHQSSLDIPVLGTLTRGRVHLWLMWDELAKYPVFGFVARRLNVLVNTTTPLRAARSLYTAYDLSMGNGRDVMIFPEGARHNDGKVHDFFAGFAMLAKKTGRPVVPVILKNTGIVCVPKTVWINYAPIIVHVGRPFMYQEGETDEQFLNRVHTWFVEHSN